ncbi:DUF1510 family protein [Alkalihalobacillus sp. R86527]|uniref:YrrS family protein n=1 Tax=Alkalihalobacillus sp. R86527 TaxID=3093863 RepID=UPI00366C1822
MKSRYNARHSKRKQNIILNGLIGIVGVVILVLIVNIFFNGGNTEPTAGEETQSNATKSTQSESNKSNTEDTVTSDEADSSDSATDEANDKDSKNEESSKEDEKSQDEKDAEEDEGTSDEGENSNDPNGEVNLDGPWEPVGTEQTGGNHVSNYDKGSVDWNEKLEAVETVVGYPKEEMVVVWMENNGSSQESKATVTQKGGDGKQYVVELEWVDEKGWKAVSARQK